MIYVIWGSDCRGGWDDRCEWHHGASSDKRAVGLRVKKLNEAVKAGDRATVERLDPTGYRQIEQFEDLRYLRIEIPELV